LGFAVEVVRGPRLMGEIKRETDADVKRETETWKLKRETEEEDDDVTLRGDSV
jgi:hypothetical protein